MRVTWKGTKALSNKFADMKTLAAAKKIVAKNGAELNRRMIENAEFHGHYRGKKFVKPTGQTRRSITLELKDDNMTAVVQPGTDYSPYLEKGTRFMRPQKFVEPSWRTQKEIFKSDLDRLVK